MDVVIGKRYMISGMVIEVVADDGDRWKTKNITTGEIVYFDKKMMQQAIKLGKAEEITADSNGLAE